MCGLAAVVGGVMRSPLTGVVFTLELTHAWSALLPLLISSTAAYALSALILKRSVLTEKIARRGLHLTREYSTDPLETFFAHEVMRPCPHAPDSRAPLDQRLADTLTGLTDAPRLIPVTAADGTLHGITTRQRLREHTAGATRTGTVADVSEPCRLAVHTDHTLRQIAYLFAETALTSAPVIDPATRRLAGVITLPDLLHARLHDLTEEHHRERPLLQRTPAPAVPLHTVNAE